MAEEVDEIYAEEPRHGLLCRIFTWIIDRLYFPIYMIIFLAIVAFQIWVVGFGAGMIVKYIIKQIFG